MTHILKAYIEHGDPHHPYTQGRAVIERGAMGAILKIEQEINGEWHPTGGSWYIRTLLKGNKLPGDTIAIDFGAKWYARGLEGAVIEACRYLAEQYDLQTVTDDDYKPLPGDRKA